MPNFSIPLSGLTAESTALAAIANNLANQNTVGYSDLIKFVEQAPDTVITLINGEKILVRESAEDVMARVVQFRQSVLQGVLRVPDVCSPTMQSLAAAPTGLNEQLKG
jgi:flagellar protein FlbD